MKKQELNDVLSNYRKWLKNIGYIPQMIFMLDDTIRKNVAFGVPEDKIDEDRLWEVLKEAQLDEFIKTLPEGLETGIGERGIRLSGGQRQRIGIARALYNDPEVLILDEPTSFLDIRYKLELLTILKNMAKEKQITVIMSLHEIDLAQKISDKILCVKGDTIFGYGEPEAIFKEDFIQKLYEIDNGHFDPVFGSVELAKAEGEAEVFVISSGGSGIPVYRNLQKAKIPFSAGILYTNDIDYHLAEHLAVSVIEEEPFEPVSDRAFERAKQMIRQCKKVINAGIVIGTTNQKMKELLVFAEEMGKLESYEK